MFINEENPSIYEEDYFHFSNGISAIDQCFLEDYNTIHKIQEAEKKITIDNQRYAYYELINDEYHLNLLEQLTIEKAWESYYEIFDLKLIGLQEGVAKYLKSLCDDGKNDNIAGDIAKIVTKRISNILNASNYENVYVFMISYSSGNHLAEEIRWEKNAWHIDKSLKGVINAAEDLYARELRYLFTIHGNSTYYYDSTKEEYREFLNSTYEYGEAYYCQKDTSCKFEENLQKEKITFAPKGYGSVHVAGKEYGSIHGLPKLHNKILTIIIPEEQEVLEGHKRYTVQSNSYLGS